MKKLLSAILLTVLATGCDWSESVQIDQVTWADDDSGHAYVKLLYEERRSANPLNGTTDKKNFRHQVFIQDTDGSNRRALTPARSKHNGAQIFYMRSAGYVLQEVLEGPDHARYDVIRMDGSSQTLVSWQDPGVPCVGLEVTPSPDGSVIAIMKRLSPGRSTDRACVAGSVEVVFYQASDLSEIGTHTWAVGGMTESTWKPNGEFVVHDYQTGDWIVDPSQGPRTTTAPNCVYPKTTSSAVSANAVMLIPGPGSNDPVHTTNGNASDVFGCQ